MSTMTIDVSRGGSCPQGVPDPGTLLAAGRHAEAAVYLLPLRAGGA